jgi:hypothetical protein
LVILRDVNDPILTTPEALLLALRQPEGWQALPEGWLEEQVRLYPWFVAPRMVLARRSAAAGAADASALSAAAVHVHSRSRLKAWMQGELDTELRNLTGQLPGEGLEEPMAAFAQPATHAPSEPDAAATDAPDRAPAATDELNARASEPGHSPAIPPDLAQASESGHSPGLEPDDAPPVRVEIAPENQPAVSRTFADWLALYSGAGSGYGTTRAPEPAQASAAAPVPEPPRASESPRAPEPVELPVFEPPPAEIDLGGDFQQLDSLIARQRELRARQLGNRLGTSSERENASFEQRFSPDDPRITQTYAGILVAQGKWAEAEAIYQALSLRYPEKSGFFASLIQELQDKKHS